MGAMSPGVAVSALMVQAQTAFAAFSHPSS
jgi:hypothetical protein